MEATQASRIELILGDAVRLLVESGADASIVGPFALKFGAKVAQRLAVMEPPKSVARDDDLQTLIQTTIEATVVKTLAIAQQHESDGGKVRLKVGPKGALTTVYLSQSLVAKAVDHFGDKRSANAKIRSLYAALPVDAQNKSRLLTGELKKALALPVP